MTERRLVHGDKIQVGSDSGRAARIPDSRHDAGTRFAQAAAPPAWSAGSVRSRRCSMRCAALASSRVLDEVLTLVMDAAIDVTGAERGFVMLANERGELEMKLARMQGRVSLSGTRFDTSRKIPEQVFATGREKVVRDLREGELADAHFAHHRARHPAGALRAAAAGPLRRPPGCACRVKTDRRAVSRQPREGDAAVARRRGPRCETLAAEAAVAIENARLYREALEKGRIEEELRMASQIQQALLPKSRTRGTFYDASGTSIACRAIGGDFFEYIDLPDGSFGFALGDVSGKGPPAALLTAMFQGIFWTQSFAPVEPAVDDGACQPGAARPRYREPLCDDLLCDSEPRWADDVLQRGAQSADALQRIRRSQTRDRRNDRRPVPSRELRTGGSALECG